MRALAVGSVLLVLGGFAAAWVLRAEPDFYLRARYPLRYEQIIEAHAANYDVDPTLLAAVIYTESRFDPEARSDEIGRASCRERV